VYLNGVEAGLPRQQGRLHELPPRVCNIGDAGVVLNQSFATGTIWARALKTARFDDAIAESQTP